MYINTFLIWEGSIHIPQPQLEGRGECLHLVFTILALKIVSSESVVRNVSVSGSKRRPSWHCLESRDNIKPM